MHFVIIGVVQERMELVEVCELELQMLCGRSVCLPTSSYPPQRDSPVSTPPMVPLPFNTIFEWGHNRLVYRDCAVVNLQSIDDPQCALYIYTRFHARVLLSSVRGERYADDMIIPPIGTYAHGIWVLGRY